MPNTKENTMTSRPFDLNTRAATLNKKNRTVEAVLATETPVPSMDYQRFESVKEVLLMSGVVLPESRQVPLLDTHDNSTIINIIGSTRDIHVEGETLVGTRHFAEDEAASKALDLIASDHLTDGSVGYRILELVHIEPGQSQLIQGRMFIAEKDMALNVVTKWELKEDSLTAIGADENAKIRTLNGDNKMPGTKTKPVVTPEESEQIGAKKERQRCADIKKLGGTDMPAALVTKCIDKGKTVEEAQGIFFEHTRSQKIPSIGSPPISVGEDLNRESYIPAASDAILTRAGFSLYEQDQMGNVVLDSTQKPKIREPHGRSSQFMGLRMAVIARQVLSLNDDLNALNYSDEKAIKMALSQRAVTSTITLPNLLANTQGRSMMASYLEYPVLWPKWAKKRTHNNFKTITRIALSELPDIELVNPNGEYPYHTIVEVAEGYEIKKYGSILGLSWEVTLNDDLNGLFDIPSKMGQAARRREDQLALSQIWANPNTSDGNALWSSAHGNLAGSGAVPSIAT